LKYVNDKDSKEVVADLKAICQSAPSPRPRPPLESFAKKWGAKYPTISKQWWLRWTDIIAMFELPPEMRKAVYTTNAIESVNSFVRKFTRNRKQYPNAESADALIYLAIAEAAKKWTMPIKGWKQALNHFAILRGPLAQPRAQLTCRFFSYTPTIAPGRRSGGVMFSPSPPGWNRADPPAFLLPCSLSF